MQHALLPAFFTTSASAGSGTPETLAGLRLIGVKSGSGTIYLEDRDHWGHGILKKDVGDLSRQKLA